MVETLESALAGQGVWAVLSVFLLLYVLRETGIREKRSLDREDKFIEIINGFKEHFGRLDNKIDTIIVDVDKIKSNMERGEKDG